MRLTKEVTHPRSKVEYDRSLPIQALLQQRGERTQDLKTKHYILLLLGVREITAQSRAAQKAERSDGKANERAERSKMSR